MDLRFSIFDLRLNCSSAGASQAASAPRGAARSKIENRKSKIASRGFTMVEILTVVGILALLAGIVAIAFNVIGNNSSTRQTRVALETAQSMLAEYAATSPTNAAPFTQGWDADVGTGYPITGRVMQQLVRIPKNKEIVDKLESKLVSKMPWSSSSAAYVVGDIVDGYICIAPHTSSSTNNTGNTTYWQPSSAASYVLKDGWGKEILYVGSSMTDATRAGNVTAPVSAPNGRPFWVSAGPDGSFDTHDDNVYSFEN